MSIKYGVMPIQYDISSIKTIECYDLTGKLLYSVNMKNEPLRYETKSIDLANYLVSHGHKLVDTITGFSYETSSFVFCNSQSLRNDVIAYEDMSKAIDAIRDNIDALLEAEKNYPEYIDDLNDYLALICSINKLIKLKAIILANMMCEKGIMSFAKKEKYLGPVVECCSELGRDITGRMIRYYMKYAKNKMEYVAYDNAMFDCC